MTEQTNEKKPPRRRRRLSQLVFVLLIAGGVGFLAYPTVANWWNTLHQSRAILQYTDRVSKMDAAKKQAIFNSALAYNVRLAQTGMLWHMNKTQQADYESQLNATGDGVMGVINIPKIRVKLPVYHGTDDKVLASSIGHISGSSLPVGGVSAHAILSGHRGLPSARLFTDLDKLKAGDTFTVNVLDETLTYEVDQIRVVLPDEVGSLKIENNRDYCTLETCTPYGINTHRLLVRGRRVPNANGDARVVADALQIRPVYIVPFIMVPVAAFLIGFVMVKNRRDAARAALIAAYFAENGLTRRPV